MEENQNKKSLKLPIIILVVILAVLLIGGIYVYSNQSPRKVFTHTIDSYINKLGKQTEDIKTLDTTATFNVNISNSQNEQINRMAEYINKAKFTVNVQMDSQQEKVLGKLGIDYENENIINAKISYKNNENRAYGFVENLYDKNFALLVDENIKTQISALLTELKNLSKDKNADTDKALNILKNSISTRLKDEYFSQEDTNITDIDGNEIKVKKSILKLTQPQFKEIISGMIEDIKKDEFINCFAEEDREEMKSTINELETKINSIVPSENDTDTLNIMIYTKGMNAEFIKFEMAYDDSNIGIYTKKIDKNTTRILVTVNSQKTGDVKVDLQLSKKVNESIEDMDISNSVNMEDLTEEDYDNIMNNLQKMKAYELIQHIILTLYNSSISY